MTSSMFIRVYVFCWLVCLCHGEEVVSEAECMRHQRNISLAYATDPTNEAQVNETITNVDLLQSTQSSCIFIVGVVLPRDQHMRRCESVHGGHLAWIKREPPLEKLKRDQPKCGPSPNRFGCFFTGLWMDPSFDNDKSLSLDERYNVSCLRYYYWTSHNQTVREPTSTYWTEQPKPLCSLNYTFTSSAHVLYNPNIGNLGVGSDICVYSSIVLLYQRINFKKYIRFVPSCSEPPYEQIMALCEVAGLSVPPTTTTTHSTTTHSTTLPPVSTSAGLGPPGGITGKQPSRITAVGSKPTQPESGSSKMQWSSKTTTKTEAQNIQATTPYQPGSPVAIIVPVVLLLVLIIVIIVMVVLRRRRKVRKDAVGNSTTDATTTDHGSATDSTQAVPKIEESGLVYDDNDNPGSVSADGDESETAAGAGLSSSSAAETTAGTGLSSSSAAETTAGTGLSSSSAAETTAGTGLSSSSAAETKASSDLTCSGATSDPTSATPTDQQTPGLPPGYELTNEEPNDGTGSLDNIPQISHEDFKQPK